MPEKFNNWVKKYESAVVGGGCFWCAEAVFSHVKGVVAVVSGYSGGVKLDPTYEEVSSGETGHAEVVKIEYDSEKIKYNDILNIFFSIHDPTTLNQQGNNIGTQYRSIILYTNKEQKNTAEKIKQELDDEKAYSGPIVTEIVPLEKFYLAEEHHQKYFEKNPEQAYCRAVVVPKLSKFMEKNKKFYT